MKQYKLFYCVEYDNKEQIFYYDCFDYKLTKAFQYTSNYEFTLSDKTLDRLLLEQKDNMRVKEKPDYRELVKELEGNKDKQ